MNKVEIELTPEQYTFYATIANKYNITVGEAIDGCTSYIRQNMDEATKYFNTIDMEEKE